MLKGYRDQVRQDRRRATLKTAMKTNIQKAAAAMGKKGGAAKTEAKKAASRTNGKKGGRPRKPKGPA